MVRTIKHRVFPVLPRIPNRMLSDNGPEFVGTEYVQLLRDFSIVDVHSSPRSPVGNGACKRVNRTIIQMLNSAVADLSSSRYIDIV